MAGTFTNNFNLILQGSGDNSGTWGTTGTPGEPGLNSGIFGPLDAILGANLTVAMSVGNNSVSLTNWTSAGIFILTGTLTGDANLILPLSPNSVGSATAIGGKFIVVNNTTGAFNVTVKTAATSSTGVVVPQGFAVSLYSDTVNVGYADNGLPCFAKAVNGNPNGQLAGTAGTVNTNAQLAWDYTNSILYVCTTTGPALTAVWTNPIQAGQTQPTPQGRLTPQSNTPVLTGDVIGASANTIYYAPYTGTWAAYHNGTSIIPFRFSQMSLLLSSSQAVNQIYDIFIAYSPSINSGVPFIGVNQAAWGTPTAGSSSRGSVAIARDATSGLWVNNATTNLIYNNGVISGTLSAVPAGRLIYLGSIFIDSGAAGQASCFLSYGGGASSGAGVPRKFGVWNAYNRVPIKMQGGSSEATWTNNVNAWRQSAGNANNQVITFFGLAEEEVEATFMQQVTLGRLQVSLGIGLNSTTVPSGVVGVATGTATSSYTVSARFVLAPTLGINNLNMLENPGSGSNSDTFFGTISGMLMTVVYNG